MDVVRDDALSGKVVPARVREIIRLEAEGEKCQWEAARLIAEELADGKTVRQLAEEIGKHPSHVGFMSKTWRVYLGRQDRPSFNEAYHSPEVRGVPAPQPRPSIPPGPSPALPSPQPSGQGQSPSGPLPAGPWPAPGPPGPAPGHVNPADFKADSPIPGYDMTPEQSIDLSMGTVERFLALAVKTAREIGAEDELRERIISLIERIFQ